MQHRTNERGYSEKCLQKAHLKIDELKTIESNQYIDKSNIPQFPAPVEFHISKLSHVTGISGLKGIIQDCGFKPQNNTSGLLYWSLDIDSDDIVAAEQRFLNSCFPQRTEAQAAQQKPFLHLFTTSPAFEKKSRYGNFRFTFPLQELLHEYRRQVCGGTEPVLRVYETILYKQEIVYSVVVHSPEVHKFDEFPLLDDNAHGVCAVKEGLVIWRPEAMSETHRHELKESSENTFCDSQMIDHEYYVWDHVVFVFHLRPGQTLCFTPERLRNTLTACENDTIKLRGNEFVDFSSAVERVNEIRTSPVE
ncbi:uncharacterized protein [Lepisosteus oculatus]|uniref:uncharacterized protein n=1 Tax=Lepisosteus oculatus TaxID=7918 RepID=UPI003711D119